MNSPTHYLAIDLGASSGRVILGIWDGERFELRELHRFANGPVAVRGHLHLPRPAHHRHAGSGGRAGAARAPLRADGYSASAHQHGMETARPILTERARALNFTNEGGTGGTIRFLKNVGGLWLLQECRRQWEREGQTYTWPALVALAEEARPLTSLVDPDAPEFLNPGDMPTAMRERCRQTAQPVPASVGALVRCCLESLALKYRWAVAALEELGGRRVDTIRIVGGGSENGLLCQVAADACARTVVAGPAEATALGNILVQAVATGRVADLAAGRRAVQASVPLRIFTPRASADWDGAFARFATLLPGGAPRAEARGG